MLAFLHSVPTLCLSVNKVHNSNATKEVIVFPPSTILIHSVKLTKELYETISVFIS